MTQRQAIEILDRTLQDIMGCIEPFGGKVIAFGGDFRQVLPVVPRGTSRVLLLTGGTKPPPTGSGKPDRFDRLPKKPVKFKIQTKNSCSIGSYRLADWLDRFTGPV